MLDEIFLRQKALKLIESRLQSVQEVQPYIQIIEFGLRQGILSKAKLSYTIKHAVLVSVFGLHQLKNADAEAYDQLYKIGALLADECLQKDIGVLVKLMADYYCSEDMCGLPRKLAEIFGEQAFEAASNQYELDGLAPQNVYNGDFPSI